MRATICLLLSTAVAKSFPYPDDFDRVSYCETCDGDGARICNSSDCKPRCPAEGKQCFKANRFKLGCCCDPQKVPPEETFKCRSGAKTSGNCMLECCKATKYAGRTTWGTICGDGCCKPSNHGAQLQCGSSWPLPLRGGKARRHPCCILKGATQDHQIGARCCLHGDGLNCSSPQQEPCCLLPSTGAMHNKSRSADPHAVCQRISCAAYVPCQTARGVDCSSRKHTVCCLKGYQPSIHDPCQASVQDCSNRYVACNTADELGIDCSSTIKGVCCLPAGKDTATCRRGDCEAYKKDQTISFWRNVSLGCIAAIVLLVVCKVCYQRFRRWYRTLIDHFEHLRPSLLLSSGELASTVPLVEHPKRVLLAIFCQNYRDTTYGQLRTPSSDADLIAEGCDSIGYDKVIKVQGSSRAAMVEGFRQAVQELAGTKQGLLLVSFSGHAVEMNSKMMWAPEDAKHGDIALHFDVASLCHDLMEFHMVDVSSGRFGAGAAKNLFVVILADCCREQVDSSHCDPFREGRRWRRRRDRPSLYIIYACGPGLKARDVAASGQCSPFMQHVVEQLWVNQRLSCFADKVAANLNRTTDMYQEVWHRECCGDFQGVSLAIPLTEARLRSGSGSSMLTENSQPEVTARRPSV